VCIVSSTTHQLDLTTDLIVLPWHDPLIDPIGFDPRSAYVEQFWLGILGPSTVWLLRRIATGFDHFPNGFEMPITDTAGALGLASGGRHSPFSRTLLRCIQFTMAREDPYGISVRRRIPPLNDRQIGRLPAPLRDAHKQWLAAETEEARQVQQDYRARLVAASLQQAGDDAEEIERQLVALGTPAAIAALVTNDLRAQDAGGR
jgi:hypothetical protein